MFCVNIAAIFNRKARLIKAGHCKTYKILRNGIKEGEEYLWKAPFDPESTASTGTWGQGIDNFRQPSYRNMGFSVNLTF